MNCIENALTTTGWNIARVKLLARFLTGLIVCRSVCLSRIANTFAGDAQTASHYKRLQRFLRSFDLNAVAVARLLLSWLQSGINLKPPYIVSLDRTNWKFGRTEINVLMLAIVYKGIAFPLLWSRHRFSFALVVAWQGGQLFSGSKKSPGASLSRHLR